MPTVQELAEEASKYFTQSKRKDGDEYWHLKKGAPQWITDMIHKAHGDMLPDDWKYEFAYQTLDAIENSSEDDLDAPQLEPDTYNHDLLRWLASHLERSGYVDEATKEWGHSEDQGVIGDIARGQLLEKEEVYHSILEYLRNRAQEEE